jgi:hypothetical protein
MAATQTHNGGGAAAVVLLGLGLIGWFVIKGNIVEPLRQQKFVQRLRIGKLYGFAIKGDAVEFKFPIENPNPEPLVIKAIVGDVIVSDKTGKAVKIGNVAHYGTDTIKPVSSTNFDLYVRISLANEFIYLSNVLQGKWKGNKLTFRGTVTTDSKVWDVAESMVIN